MTAMRQPDDGLVIVDDEAYTAEEWAAVQRFKAKQAAKAAAYQAAYQQRPEAKAKKAAYRQRPEVKAKAAAYQQRPEVKAKAKARYDELRRLARLAIEAGLGESS